MFTSVRFFAGLYLRLDRLPVDNELVAHGDQCRHRGQPGHPHAIRSLPTIAMRWNRARAIGIDESHTQEAFIVQDQHGGLIR